MYVRKEIGAVYLQTSYSVSQVTRLFKSRAHNLIVRYKFQCTKPVSSAVSNSCSLDIAGPKSENVRLIPQ